MNEKPNGKDRGSILLFKGVLMMMMMCRMLVDELPSWVYFPDKERAEWLNNIIKQLWPNVNTYVR